MRAWLWLLCIVGIAACAFLIWAGTWAYLIADQPTASATEGQERSLGLTHGQASRTADTWLARDGDLTDTSGNRFVKTAGWQRFDEVVFTQPWFRFEPDGRRASLSVAVRGKYMGGFDAARVWTYSAQAQFGFERQADGRWRLTNVTLGGVPPLTEARVAVIHRHLVASPN
jgi:hypothetical protein